MGTRCLILLDQLLPGWCPEKAYRLLSPMQHSMDWISLQQTLENAYLQFPSYQRDYIICGPKFKIEYGGHVALIHRALYGGKSAGKDFWNHLRSCMHHLNLKSSPANPMYGCDHERKVMGSHVTTSYCYTQTIL